MEGGPDEEVVHAQLHLAHNLQRRGKGVAQEEWWRCAFRELDGKQDNEHGCHWAV
jgi:hypothetical protein